MRRSESGRLDHIDVLRGLAALCVVLSHYTSHCLRYLGETPFLVPSIYGFYAVELFFIISGFVISLTLEQCSSWRDFAFFRASRLFPTYWTAITAMVLIESAVFHHGTWAGGYIVNMTMFQEFLGYQNLDYDYWSLTVELAFYGAMAVFLSCGLLQRIELLSLGWLALCCLWTILDQFFGISAPEFLVRVSILPYLPFFVAGMMFYRIYTRGLSVQRIMVMSFALAAEWLMHGAVNFAIAAGLCTIFGVALLGRINFLVSPITLWLGAISYPLYLIHRNLGYSAIDRLHEAGVSVPLALALTIAAALGLAVALSHLVERPALRALRRMYRKRRMAIA